MSDLGAGVAGPMIGKLLLTLAVILVAYAVIRGRAAGSASGVPAPSSVLVRSVRIGAYLVLALMLVGSAFYLFGAWRRDQEIVVVQIVNASSGAIIEYRARRGALDGRRFETIDGQEVRLADVERMIVQAVPKD